MLGVSCFCLGNKIARKRNKTMKTSVLPSSSYQDAFSYSDDTVSKDSVSEESEYTLDKTKRTNNEKMKPTKMGSINNGNVKTIEEENSVGEDIAELSSAEREDFEEYSNSEKNMAETEVVNESIEMIELENAEVIDEGIENFVNENEVIVEDVDSSK